MESSRYKSVRLLPVIHLYVLTSSADIYHMSFPLDNRKIKWLGMLSHLSAASWKLM